MSTYILLLISHFVPEGGCSGGDGNDTLYWVAIKVPMKIARKLIDTYYCSDSEEDEEDKYIDIADLDLDDVNRLWDSLRRHLRTEAETQSIDLPEYLFNNVMGFFTVDREIELCVIQNKGWSCCSGWTRYLHASEFVAEPSEYDDNAYDMTTESAPDLDITDITSMVDIKVLEWYSIQSVEFTFTTPFFQEVSLPVAVPAPEAAVATVAAVAADGALVAVAAPPVAFVAPAVADTAASASSSSDDDD